MVTDTNIYNFGLKDNYGDFIIAVYIAIGGCVVSKFIRVVIVLFLGIAGYFLLNGNIRNNRNAISSSLRSQCKSVYVRGYYRRDGTYVRPHYRRRPNRRRRL